MSRTTDNIQTNALKALKQHLDRVYIYKKVLGRAKDDDIEKLIEKLSITIYILEDDPYHLELAQRQKKEAFKKAKAIGTHISKPATIDYDAIRAELAKGIHPRDIVKDLGVSKAAVYRAKGPSEKPNPRPSKLVKHHDRIVEAVKGKEERKALYTELGVGKKTLQVYIKQHVLPYLGEEFQKAKPQHQTAKLIQHHDRICQSVRDGEKRVDLQLELDVNRKTLYKYIKLHVLPQLEEEAN
ncbi:MAG: hypothetical protein GY804_00175 [Alphaproteobacteria bacterium]|nr:hypothetical protein [Alphaproteobacteria bacterium]